MNNATMAFNTLMNRAYDNISLISTPQEKAVAIGYLLSAIAQTGAVEKESIFLAGEEQKGPAPSNREQLENHPNEVSAAPARSATPAQAATQAAVTPAVTAAAAQQNMTSAQLADTWTPEMIEMFKPTYMQVGQFLASGIKQGAFTPQWISEQLRLSSGGKITQFCDMNSIPPRFIKVFASFLSDAWNKLRAQQQKVA